MTDGRRELKDQVEAVIQRLIADPAAGPTPAELAAAAVAVTPTSGLSMAEMVETTGLSEHTLRYYEREGLVAVSRGAGGRRRYDEAAVQRVLLVTRMRISGMPIDTLRNLTHLLDAHGPGHPQVRTLLEAHRDQLERHIAELQLALAITRYKLETGDLGLGAISG